MNERYVKGKPMKYKVKIARRVNGYRITGYIFCSLREAVRLRGQKKND